MPSFSKSSAQRLATCDRRLQDLFNEVICYQDCTVVCGHRDKEAQNAAFDAGLSRRRWPYGNHNTVPSLAADVVPYPIDWADIEKMTAFARLVKEVAAKLEIKIVWGGDWKDFPDHPHYEIA
jgi:hypothetical protein